MVGRGGGGRGTGNRKGTKRKLRRRERRRGNYSKQAEVENVDRHRIRRFFMEWRNEMKVRRGKKNIKGKRGDGEEMTE